MSRLNSKRLLRKVQKMLGGYFILPHPVYSIFGFILSGSLQRLRYIAETSDAFVTVYCNE